MEVYKNETREVVNRFLRRRLSFPDCIAALDAALAGVLPRIEPAQLGALRELMLANNAIVMKEMERRAQARKVKPAAVEGPPQAKRCVHCQAETEMVEGGVPTCAQCAKPKVADAPKAVQETIRSVLQEELKWATERAATASAAFLEITSQVPSGLPHPDGTQRIRNLSHELAFARAELMKAHSRLEAYLMNGTTPDDLNLG